MGYVMSRIGTESAMNENCGEFIDALRGIILLYEVIHVKELREADKRIAFSFGASISIDEEKVKQVNLKRETQVSSHHDCVLTGKFLFLLHTNSGLYCPLLLLKIVFIWDFLTFHFNDLRYR